MSESIIILVGPSGAGKTSFLERALADYDRLRDIITYTTRDMRPGEKEGDPYHFVSKEKFEALIKEDFFVEYANVHTNIDHNNGNANNEGDRSPSKLLPNSSSSSSNSSDSSAPWYQGIFEVDLVFKCEAVRGTRKKLELVVMWPCQKAQVSFIPL